ncbi:MAG TPA: hypothetical protein PLS10_13665 [Chitinophagales bacterium]|nr:hypothetical protein [Chitinophagales bacterium]
MLKKVISTSKIFALIGLLITLAQMLFDLLNVANLNENTKIYVGAIGMVLAIINSGFKQFFDKNIDNRTIYLQLLLFIGFVAGGILDHFNQLDFLGQDTTAVMRVTLTFISTSIPIIIKTINEIE